MVEAVLVVGAFRAVDLDQFVDTGFERGLVVVRKKNRLLDY